MSHCKEYGHYCPNCDNTFSYVEPASIPAARPEQTALMELDDLMWDSKPSSYNAMPDATHNRQILEAFHRGQVTACNNYEALKESHAAMMDALKDMKSGWTYIREVYGDLYGVGWDRAEILAKEALANARKIMEGL